MIGYRSTRIPDLWVGSSDPVTGRHGRAIRTFVAGDLAAAGGPLLSWADQVESHSPRGMVRGLHLRLDARQWKHVRVARGRVLDVVVDLRTDRGSHLRVVTTELGPADHVVVPPGCAHGLQVLSQEADVVLTSSEPADPALDRGIRYDDPALHLDWPLAPALLEDRDLGWPSLAAVLDQLATSAPSPSPATSPAHQSTHRP